MANPKEPRCDNLLPNDIYSNSSTHNKPPKIDPIYLCKFFRLNIKRISKPRHPIYTAQKNTPIKRDPAADTAAGAVNEPAPPEYTGAAVVSVGLAVEVASVEDAVEVAVVEARVKSSQFHNHSDIL